VSLVLSADKQNTAKTQRRYTEKGVGKKRGKNSNQIIQHFTERKRTPQKTTTREHRRGARHEEGNDNDPY
jgi:hypothetical protein